MGGVAQALYFASRKVFSYIYLTRCKCRAFFLTGVLSAFSISHPLVSLWRNVLYGFGGYPQPYPQSVLEGFVGLVFLRELDWFAGRFFDGHDFRLHVRVSCSGQQHPLGGLCAFSE